MAACYAVADLDPNRRSGHKVQERAISPRYAATDVIGLHMVERWPELG